MYGCSHCQFNLSLSFATDWGTGTIYIVYYTCCQAKKSVKCDFEDLLPVAASVNLATARRLPKVQSFLERGHEVAINLDQNVSFQATCTLVSSLIY